LPQEGVKSVLVARYDFTESGVITGGVAGEKLGIIIIVGNGLHWRTSSAFAI
jgi:hypothetical protein